MTPTFSLQRGFLNVSSGKNHFQLFLPDGHNGKGLPPINEAYDYLVGLGLDGESIMKRLIRTYMPFRFVKGNHVANRTLVTGLIGARGSGKSCTGSAITVYDYLIHGRPVWSNMEIMVTFRYKDASITYRTVDFEKLNLFKLDRSFQGGCLFLDEINIEFSEARRSTRTSNLQFSYMLQQLRHRDLDLVFTTQSDTWLDQRLRFQTDLFIYCKDAALTPSGRENGAKLGHYSYLDVYDFSGIYTGQSYTSGDWPIWTGTFWMRPFWGVYDTFEIQGMDEGPGIGIQIRETERLTELKRKQDEVEILISEFRGRGIKKVPSSLMWTVAGAESRSEQTRLGMALARAGIEKVSDGNGGWMYDIAAN